MLRRGKKLLEEITEHKDSIRKKCQYEDELKDIRSRKQKVNEQLGKLKDTFNQTSGYNVRLDDDLKQTKFELKNSRYKDITKKLADVEIKYTLAKLMAQEVSE